MYIASVDCENIYEQIETIVMVFAPLFKLKAELTAHGSQRFPQALR